MAHTIHAGWRHPHTPSGVSFISPDTRDWPPESLSQPLRQPGQSYCEFLDSIGAVGMGGSQFPAASKLAASQNIKTLIINGVECEPGITIDKALLLHHSDYIKAGAEASATACGASEIVVAVAAGKTLSEQLRELYPDWRILQMPPGYPGGAERLLVKKLTGKMLPAGTFPGSLGILVQNTATVRSIGRALLDNIPVVERPLTLTAPRRNIHRDLIVPIGVTFGDVLKLCDVDYNQEKEVLIAGGLMMGRLADLQAEVSKGTTSIVIVPRKMVRFRERECINCGACHKACPLNLHPIGIVRRLRNSNGRASKALELQLKTCFLCGACSAVCPSRIPLVKVIRGGKTCR